MIFDKNHIKTNTIVAVMFLYGNASCENRERILQSEACPTKEVNEQTKQPQNSPKIVSDNHKNNQDEEVPTSKYKLLIDQHDENALKNICSVILCYIKDVVEKRQGVSFHGFLSDNKLSVQVKEGSNPSGGTELTTYTITGITKCLRKPSKDRGSNGNSIYLNNQMKTVAKKLLQAIYEQKWDGKQGVIPLNTLIFGQLYDKIKELYSQDIDTMKILENESVKCQDKNCIQPFLEIAEDLMVRLLKYAEQQISHFVNQENKDDLVLNFMDYKDNISSFGDVKLSNYKEGCQDLQDKTISQPGIPFLFIFTRNKGFGQSDLIGCGYIRSGVDVEDTNGQRSQQYVIKFSHHSASSQKFMPYGDVYLPTNACTNIEATLGSYFRNLKSNTSSSSVKGFQTTDLRNKNLRKDYDLNQGTNLRTFLGMRIRSLDKLINPKKSNVPNR